MPTTQRIEFPNQQGQQLSAALMLPDVTSNGHARGYVLFAHCFTCGKNIAVASRLSRMLAAKGLAVLRFDFTGIGNSEGDFANTDFASNVDDLVAAADFLRENYRAPDILIGHSLGGAAILAAASAIPESRAVVTLAAPASAENVVERLGRGDGRVHIGSESFAVDADFVASYDLAEMQQRIGALRKALLVMHAPLDDTVPVEQASLIFAAARHPKSFVSLDAADHLLSSKADAEYVAQTVTAWASRYLPEPEPEPVEAVANGELHVGELNRKFLRSVVSDDHTWLADEPLKMGGANLGPDPYEHLLAALGTCTSMTLRMYANRKELPLEDVDIVLAHSREHARDCEDCDEAPRKIEVLTRRIRLTGDLTDAQRQRLLEIADRCPVHRTLEAELHIRTELDAR